MSGADVPAEVVAATRLVSAATTAALAGGDVLEELAGASVDELAAAGAVCDGLLARWSSDPDAVFEVVAAERDVDRVRAAVTGVRMTCALLAAVGGGDPRAGT